LSQPAVGVIFDRPLGKRTDSNITRRWRGIPQQVFAWREWDGEFVVLDLRSGDIHLLSTFAGMVLLKLSAAQSPRTVGELARQLETATDYSDADCAAAIEAILADFHRLELAELESP